MVVHRSDMFGLRGVSAAYRPIQMRAYAYLTYDDDEANSAGTSGGDETLDTLGAGFQLASHDMDIRGAGNLW